MFFVNVSNAGESNRVFIDNNNNVRGVISLDYGIYHEEYAQAYELDNSDNIENASVVDDPVKSKALIDIARKHISNKVKAINKLLARVC